MDLFVVVYFVVLLYCIKVFIYVCSLIWLLLRLFWFSGGWGLFVCLLVLICLDWMVDLWFGYVLFVVVFWLVCCAGVWFDLWVC